MVSKCTIGQKLHKMTWLLTLKTSYRRLHLAASTSVVRTFQMSSLPASAARLLCWVAIVARSICRFTLSSISTYKTTTCRPAAYARPVYQDATQDTPPDFQLITYKL
jgi:hypothetical protein